MGEQYWAVAECMTQRVEEAGREIPDALVPMFRRTRLKGGKEWYSRVLPRFGQYIFFPINAETAAQDERRAADTDGVYRIVRVSGQPGRVTEAEMARLRVGNCAWDEIERATAEPAKRRYSIRKSRPSKRARVRAARRRAAMLNAPAGA